MRKQIKQNILDIIKTIYDAHDDIKKLLKKGYKESAASLIGDCQDAALSVGNTIIDSEGEEFVTVRLIENYCKDLFEIYNSLDTNDSYDCDLIYKTLNRELTDIKKSIEKDIRAKIEVVFMPYKASMWDSLESVWKAADEDPDCDAYVVPIPYYDRNPDHSFGEFHYEGDQFPDYVPVTSYRDYDERKRKPDVIYIHNPYDDCNYVTSVAPRFYSFELKKYTNMLAYIPYYVVHSENSKNIIFTSGAINANAVFVQSEIVKNWYYEVYADTTVAEELKTKLSVIGSPKVDKMVSLMNTSFEIPAMWKSVLEGKKVLFLNSNVSMLLRKGDSFIEDMLCMFNKFEKRCDEWAVIWREHPLTMSTLKSMRTEFMNDYLSLKQYFIEKNLGIIDEFTDPYPAMLASDCYYGSGGSMAVLYGVYGKPILITKYTDNKNLSDENVSVNDLMNTLNGSFLYRERSTSSLDVFLDNIDKINEQKQERLEYVKKFVTNIDGTVGKNIYYLIKSKCKEV